MLLIRSPHRFDNKPFHGNHVGNIASGISSLICCAPYFPVSKFHPFYAIHHDSCHKRPNTTYRSCQKRPHCAPCHKRPNTMSHPSPHRVTKVPIPRQKRPRTMSEKSPYYVTNVPVGCHIRPSSQGLTLGFPRQNHIFARIVIALNIEIKK